MKSIFISIFVVFWLLFSQEPHDITDEVSFLQRDISYGNGCIFDPLDTRDFVNYGDAHLGGHKIEMNNGKLTITGDLYIEGGEILTTDCEYSQFIINGQIIY